MQASEFTFAHEFFSSWGTELKGHLRLLGLVQVGDNHLHHEIPPRPLAGEGEGVRARPFNVDDRSNANAMLSSVDCRKGLQARPPVGHEL